jgi:hypothetical protein
MSSFYEWDNEDEEWDDEVLETEVEDEILETKSNAEYEVLEKEDIQILKIDSSMYKLLVYILGRFNPVHDGHMATVMAAIELAKVNGGKALILLGDGDKKTKGTIENPLDFELKKEIMEGRIPSKYHGHYEIEQKTGNPVSHIRLFIGRNHEDGKMPYIVHLTASKAAKEGEQSDADKLAFINDYLSKEFANTHSHAINPIKTEGIDLSATAIRKDAVRLARYEFIKKYWRVYGRKMAGQVYDKINEAYAKSPMPLQAKYIERNDELPKKRSQMSAKHGGGTRKRTNKRSNGTRKGTRKRVYKSIAK